MVRPGLQWRLEPSLWSVARIAQLERGKTPARIAQLERGKDTMPETQMVAEQPDQDQVAALRRDRHRRRDFRHVHALPPARAGHDRAGVRGRHQCRRHLVLEPLSRRPLRFRKLDLWLFVFQGADAGMGLEGAFLPPTRHAGIPELRRRQVRPAPGHAVPQHGEGRALG